jgi:hypothetical protein
VQTNREDVPDLFGVQGDDLAQGYATLRDTDLKNNRPFKSEVIRLWQPFFPYADSNFVEEFARNMHQRYWEMYLGCALLDLGLDLQIQNDNAGPDHCINYEGQKIWFEAIAPTKGDDDNCDQHIFQPIQQLLFQAAWFCRPNEQSTQLFVGSRLVAEQLPTIKDVHKWHQFKYDNISAGSSCIASGGTGDLL